MTADIDRSQPRQSIACADAAALATPGAASTDGPVFQSAPGPVVGADVESHVR